MVDQPFECGEAYLLRAMMDSSVVVEAVARAGPGLFREPATRWIAAELVAGRGVPVSSANPRTREALAAVCACDAGIDEGWGLYLVRYLAESRYRDLLADQLDWAAKTVREGRATVGHVRAHVLRALDIAEGKMAIDGSENWTVAA